MHTIDSTDFFLDEYISNANKDGTAQVQASLKFQKTIFRKFAKDTMVKIYPLHTQCWKFSKGIRISLENHFFFNWKEKSHFLKIIFLQFSLGKT